MTQRVFRGLHSIPPSIRLLSCALPMVPFHVSPRSSLQVTNIYSAILTLQPTSQPMTKAAGLQRHQIAVLVGLPSILLGTLAMWTYKASHGAPHITTWHAVRASSLPRVAL